MTVIEGFDAQSGRALRIALEGGKIVSSEEMAPKPELPRLLPALADNHCHILPTGLDMQKLWLGACESKAQVLDALRDRAAQTEGRDWVLAVHYDQTKFVDGHHIHRRELDAIDSTKPILVRHVNGHASVANSAALMAAGVDQSTANPLGGVFVRDASGEFTGLLLETAHEKVTAAVPNPTTDQMVKSILDACHSMHSMGICGAADMMTGRFDLESELIAYRRASESGCPVALRLYLQWSTVFGPRRMDSNRLQELIGNATPGFRVAGIKIFADGAIGSRTAAIYGQFQGSDGSTDEGTLIYAPEKLKAMVQTAHDAGYSVAIHTIGDRSTDHVMDAFEATGDPARHRIEHIMIMSDEQLERLAKLGCHATFQPEFLSAFGHSYQRQLGELRASKLIRMRSAQEAGIPFSISSDRPIVTGNPEVAIRNSHARPAGFDPSENITLEQAWHAHTTMGWIGVGDRPSFEPGSITGAMLQP